LALTIRNYRAGAESRQRLTAVQGELEAWRSGNSPEVALPPPLPPIRAPGGVAQPQHMADAGALGRFALIGARLAVVIGVTTGLLGRGYGIHVPIYGPIAFTIVLAQLLSQALERRRKQRPPR
jgi:hypothetical protein